MAEMGGTMISEIATLNSLRKKRKSIIDRNSIDGSFSVKKSQKIKNDNEKSSWDKKVEIEKKISSLEKEIGNIPENETRKSFGYKPIGEQWVNETLIYKICKELFAEYEVIHHHRPKFLDGMELDIFIKELQIGIEYQGRQHYEPIDFFGGEESLEQVQERDKKKRELCSENDVNLIYINYKEEVSKGLIRNKVDNVKNQDNI